LEEFANKSFEYISSEEKEASKAYDFDEQKLKEGILKEIKKETKKTKGLKTFEIISEETVDDEAFVVVKVTNNNGKSYKEKGKFIKEKGNWKMTSEVEEIKCAI